MDAWLAVLIVGGCASAVLLWSAVARTKEVSEHLLREYEHLLAEARRNAAACDDDSEERK
jgi:hypothetical protein